MMDSAPLFVPVIAAPLEQVAPRHDLHPVKKRRRGTRDAAPTISPGGALFVGAIILLSGSDGQAVPCEVVQVNPLICVPVK